MVEDKDRKKKFCSKWIYDPLSRPIRTFLKAFQATGLNELMLYKNLILYEIIT